MKFHFKVSAFYCDFLPIVLFIFSIPVDAINGYFQYFKGVHLPIGFIFRGTILFFIIKYVFKDVHEAIHKLFLSCMIIFLLVYPIYFLLGNKIDIMVEIEYIFKLVYFFSVVFYFYHFRFSFDIIKLIKIVILAIFILGCINLFSLITGIGIPSYVYGFGYSGFYYGGNELGIYMILSLLICIWYSFYSKSLLYLSLTIIASCGIVVIGTRVAVLGTFLDWSMCTFYFLINKDKFIKIRRIYRAFFLFFILVSMIGIMGYVYRVVIKESSYMSEKFSSDGLFSSRSLLINSAKNVIRDFDNFEILFGKSISGGRSELALIYHTKSQQKNVESDFYDMILSFGFLLGGMLILLYLKMIWQYILPFYRKNIRSSLSFVICMSAFVFLGAAYTAGHTFGSVDLAPLLGLYWVISINFSNYNFKMSI